jgi:hypothetical protein
MFPHHELRGELIEKPLFQRVAQTVAVGIERK